MKKKKKLLNVINSIKFFTISANNENPVLCDEYLQAHKAEILAGPIELSSCMDLCDHGGLVTLTSPKLFKTRARNFLLHIKTMIDPAKEGRSKTRGKHKFKKKNTIFFYFHQLYLYFSSY